MFKRSRGTRKLGPVNAADGLSQTLAHSAEEAANRVGGAVENASARVARETNHVSGRVAKEAGNVSGSVAKQAGRVRGRAAQQRIAAGDALLKAQLAKTSRELAHQSSELGDAVHSLNKAIRANRRAAARGRTRLLGGLALGAALMYHFDPQRGKERRSVTAKRLAGVTGRDRGGAGPTEPVT